MGRLPVEDEGWQKQGTASNHEEDEGPRSLGDKMPGTIYTRDVRTAPSGLVDSEKATNPRGSTVCGAGARPTEGPEPGELRQQMRENGRDARSHERVSVPEALNFRVGRLESLLRRAHGRP